MAQVVSKDSLQQRAQLILRDQAIAIRIVRLDDLHQFAVPQPLHLCAGPSQRLDPESRVDLGGFLESHLLSSTSLEVCYDVTQCLLWAGLAVLGALCEGDSVVACSRGVAGPTRVLLCAGSAEVSAVLLGEILVGLLGDILSRRCWRKVRAQTANKTKRTVENAHALHATISRSEGSEHVAPMLAPVVFMCQQTVGNRSAARVRTEPRVRNRNHGHKPLRERLVLQYNIRTMVRDKVGASNLLERLV
eukprot:6098202-Prymnesium_polylepis.3